jgi:D-xylulose reductase
MSDVQQPKLDLAQRMGSIIGVNVAESDPGEKVRELSQGWGADIVFECSGNPQAAAGVFDLICPGGRVVFVGMPGAPIAYDVVAAQVKEARVEHVFRYAHVYPRAVALMAAGKIDVKPLITNRFPFEDCVRAFDFACKMPPDAVKAQIEME